jgi:hypothetical protein
MCFQKASIRRPGPLSTGNLASEIIDCSLMLAHVLTRARLVLFTGVGGGGGDDSEAMYIIYV